MVQETYLQTGSQGFQIIYNIDIINGTYLNIQQDEIEIYRQGDISCIVRSREPSKEIRQSERIAFILGTFIDKDSAVSYAEEFIFSVRYYLSYSKCAYRLNWKVKDLSIHEIEIESSVTMNLIAPLKFGEMLPTNTPHLNDALTLLEKAEQAEDTAVAFSLYVVTLESILDPEDSKVSKEGLIIELIDAAQTHIDNYIMEKRKYLDAGKQIKEKLDELRTLGSRNAVKRNLKKYCPGKTISRNGKAMTYAEIYNTCYGLRNKFLHNGVDDKEIGEYISAIREIAYEVIAAYAKA